MATNPVKINRVMLASLVEETNVEMASDLGGCAYLERLAGTEGYEEGICSFGCHEEPECMTCEPEGGWPSRREGYDYDEAWIEALAGWMESNLTELIDSPEFNPGGIIPDRTGKVGKATPSTSAC